MKRRDLDRVEDITSAAESIRRYLVVGSLNEGVVFDAVLYRLIQIGEAVKALTPELLQQEPHVDWSAAARLRDRLTHRYWDTAHAVVVHVVEHDLEPMVLAVARIREALKGHQGG